MTTHLRRAKPARRTCSLVLALSLCLAASATVAGAAPAPADRVKPSVTLTATLKKNECKLTAAVKGAPKQAKVRFERKVGSAWKSFSSKSVGKGASNVKIPCAKQAGSKVRASLLQGKQLLSSSKVVTQPLPDTTAPVVTIYEAPDSATREPSPTFRFTVSEPGTFVCRLYPTSGAAPAFGPCSGPGKVHTVPEPLADDTYVFQVRATDKAGNVGPVEGRTFTVDTTPPVVTILTGPSGPTNETVPVFTFSVSEDAGLECRVFPTGNPVAFGSCSGPGNQHEPAAPLAEGAYTFQARAWDAAGNTSATANRTFTVDTTPPETTMTSGPDPEGAFSPVVFTYESSEANSTFVCSTIEGSTLFPCFFGTSTVHYFQSGPMTFSAAAIDPAGNQDPTPATWTFINKLS